MQILMVATQPFAHASRLSLRLKRYGMNVKAICPTGSALAKVSSAGTSYTFSTWNPLGSLKAALDKCHPDFIIPTDDRSVWLLHELSGRIPEYKRLVERSIGPSTSYPIVRSRAKLLALAVELGIAVPPTYHIGSYADLGHCLKTEKLPLFLKKDGTWAGSGVTLIANEEEAAATYHRLLQEPSLPVRLRRRLRVNDPTAFAKLACLGKPEISAQALIQGVPANAMFACDKGKILGSVQARVISARGKLGGALMLELIEDDRISQAGSLLAESLGMSGFFGLDFVIEDGSGIPYLIEMNARCTQLGHVAIANKPDLAGILWAHLTGSELPESGSPQLGPFISIYPQAVQWDPNSPFLSHSRFDLDPEDLEAVTELSKVKRSFKNWVYGRIRGGARSLRSSVRPAPAWAIHYFDTARNIERNLPDAPSSEGSASKASRHLEGAGVHDLQS